MIIGNMRFSIEKNRKYEPEELAELILREPYGFLCAENLMLYNTHAWMEMPCMCFSEEKGGKIFLHPMLDAGDEKDETYAALDELISYNPIGDATDDLKKWLHKRKNRDIEVSVVRHGLKYSVLWHNEGDTPEELFYARKRELFELFLRDAGICDTASLRKAAREATELFQEQNETGEDPFVFPPC